MSEMIKVEFWGGTGANGPEVGVNYMVADYVDEDGDDAELYAEIEVPKELDENEAEEYGYEKLKKEIIQQAKEVDIDVDRLRFQLG